MKVRLSFVTNSSSSSFIIGAPNSSYTVDDIYDVIKEEVLKEEEKYKNFIKIMDENGIKYRLLQSFCPYTKEVAINEEASRKKFQELEFFTGDEQYKNTFSSFSFYIKEEIVFDTYEKYSEYWDKKTKEIKYSCAPFAIYDLSKKQPVFSLGLLEYSSTKCTCGKIISNNLYNSFSREMMYFFEFPNYIYTYMGNCKICENWEYCDSDAKAMCKETKERIIKEKIPSEKCALFFLGKILVRSFHGLKDQTYRRLQDMSNLHSSSL